MRLTEDSEEAKNLKMISVICPHCKARKVIPLDLFLELDTDEGWVDHIVPRLPSTTLDTGEVDPDTDNPNNTGSFEYETHRLEGKVEVFWNE